MQSDRKSRNQTEKIVKTEVEGGAGNEQKVIVTERTSTSEEAGIPLVDGSAPGGVTGEYTFISTDLVETTDEAEAGLLHNSDVCNPIYFLSLFFSFSNIYLLLFLFSFSLPFLPQPCFMIHICKYNTHLYMVYPVSIQPRV